MPNHSPTEIVLAWVDALDPLLRTTLAIVLSGYGPRAWTNGASDGSDPWTRVRSQILEEVEDDPIRNVGIALCLRSLISFYLTNFTDETAEERAEMHREMYRTTAATPELLESITDHFGRDGMEVLEVLDQQLVGMELEVRRSRRAKDGWSSLLESSLTDDAMAKWLTSEVANQPPA